MSSARPEILFPLFADHTGLKGIGPKSAQALTKAGLATPRDLLFSLPSGYVDRRLAPGLTGLTFPRTVTLKVTIGRHVPGRGKAPYRIMVDDGDTGLQLVFFHPRADWIKKNLPSGQVRIISGKVELFDGIAQMAHPDYILRETQLSELPEFEPVYPLTAGITQKTMRRACWDALSRAPDFSEWIDASLLRERKWPAWRDALTACHQPEPGRDIEAARDRLAYDELLAHQLTLAIARARRRRKKGRLTSAPGRLRSAILSSLPYQPTKAQKRVTDEILADMSSQWRMARLLQGDVGAGKTLVAMLALSEAIEAGGQGAMMAPTEILARQHFASMSEFCRAADIECCLITGRDKGTLRAQKLNDIATGKAQLVIGTHALFQEDVQFSDLRLAVVDEQHKFGVAQRMRLADKSQATDMLVMTATPIPRSLALAQYGDMDLSILDEKPAGRQEIETVLLSEERYDELVDRLRSAIAAGRRAYWVCPLVNESELIDATAVTARFAALRAALGEEQIAMVHGQMPPETKDAEMKRFAEGEAKVLVATTAIEVGVDVPEATIMVIEKAERFGLAQLHQLRGRVGRGSEASSCILLYEPPLGETASRRLRLLKETNDGFRIAEEDLAIRGAGDVLGVEQSGLPRFRIADLERDFSLMQVAQKDARNLIERDANLQNDRGQAARNLLYLLGFDQAIYLMGIG